MMNKQRTHNWLRAKYLLLVPVMAVALVACNLGSPKSEGVKADSLENVDEELPVVDTVTVASSPADAFDVVEEKPEFPGGQQALMEYLQKNMKYPKEAQEKGTQGRVMVQFVIDKDGSIVEPEVVRSVSPELDAEALRVVKMMPKWQPGKQEGKVVRVKYNLPVSFKLQ